MTPRPPEVNPGCEHVTYLYCSTSDESGTVSIRDALAGAHVGAVDRAQTSRSNQSSARD